MKMIRHDNERFDVELALRCILPDHSDKQICITSYLEEALAVQGCGGNEICPGWGNPARWFQELTSAAEAAQFM